MLKRILNHQTFPDGSVNGAASLENGPAISQNAKHKLPYNQTILLRVSIPKGTRNVFMQKPVHACWQEDYS